MSELQEVEVSIDAAKKAIADAELMTKFVKSDIYKELIDVGYCKDYASRLVLMKADPSMAKPEMQASIVKSIDGIGEFRQYVNSVLQMGHQARSALKDDEETHQELMQEEVS